MVSESSNRTQLLGLAEWLKEILKLTAKLEEVSPESTLTTDYQWLTPSAEADDRNYASAGSSVAFFVDDA